MISRRELMAVALTLILIAACVAYVDRPVAEFAAARLPESALFPLAIAILRPLDLVLGMMVLWLVGCAVWSARGDQFDPWAGLLVRASVAGVTAAVVAVLLKFVIGSRMLVCRAPAHPRRPAARLVHTTADCRQPDCDEGSLGRRRPRRCVPRLVDWFAPCAVTQPAVEP